MKMRRFIALALCLCMLLTISNFASAATLYSSETLSFEQVSGLNKDFTQVGKNPSDLALEKLMVDENGMVEVFIIMEGKSVLETNISAEADNKTLAQMTALKGKQDQIISKIETNVLDGQKLDVTYNYAWLFNGVAATIPYSAMSEIAAMEGVKQVIVQPKYELFKQPENEKGTADMFTVSDGGMIGREDTWTLGYTGEGMKIAIIDTGLDVDHQNFAALPADKLTDTSATMDDLAAVLENLNAADRYRDGLTAADVYYNSKVVYGFNYADDSLDITHDNDMMGDHGTHVAGIAAANKVDGSDVVGVAPDAQLYIMKVFGAKRGGVMADIVAALEDALILGVDVVNMSLGTNAGFTSNASDFINEIYARVAETNTVLSVSAGNNYTAGFYNLWGTDANLTTNPDDAVIGEPGSYKNVLSVASVSNMMIMRNYILVSDGYKMGYIDTGISYGLPYLMDLAGCYNLVDCGLGSVEEFAGLDLTGKVALVQRGEISFMEKCENAAAAGAVACLVYNNTTGEFGMDLTGCTAGIPCAAITMEAGEHLLSAMEKDANAQVSFPQDLTPMPNENAYHMSDFSSRGAAPNLTLEPDITAPGGNIYSTINNGQYGVMSGTSMAAPNISGLTALVMQHALKTYETNDYRSLVQNLLMSTAMPLGYGAASGLYYSPRWQGSGLANAYNAITSNVYLTVAGSDTPKVSLGDDANKTGAYEFTYTVNNMGSGKAYYSLNTVVQTEDVVAYDAYEGKYFMSSSPRALYATAVELSGSLMPTFDLDGNTVTDTRDAYQLYLAANGMAEDGWKEESFRYDANGDEAVDNDDVQAYLDALVGNDSKADLDEKVLCVEGGQSVDVTVSIELTEEDRTYFETYYTNGGYVEGFSFLTARHNGGVDLSLPYMGFYGSWDSAPVIDDGDYWDLLEAEETEVIGNQYYNVLWTNFAGQASYYYPGANVYVDEPFDKNHISVSPNGDGYFDTIDDIYLSLLRNAKTLTYRYVNADTGEVYYDYSVGHVNKSVYNANYDQIVPSVYSWYAGEMPAWEWKDNSGHLLPNNTHLRLEIEAIGDYEGATADVWSAPVTIDLEKPELLNLEKKVNNVTGEVTLELTFRENVGISVAMVMSSNGNIIYGKDGVEDVTPAEDGYQYHTVSFDVTGATGKLMILLSDYAMNEAYYGMNLGGEGTSYGELVAYQYDFDNEQTGWISFGEGVNKDEIMINRDDMNFVSAEYINGYVFAQTETGALYGFKYTDMLVDSFDIESTYIATLENTYQDLAYSYVEGKLYGILVDVYQGYPTTDIYTINLNGEYYDEEMWTTVGAYEETWALGRGGLYGLTVAVDDEGTLYVLGLNYDEDGRMTAETAQLWSVGMEYDRWSGAYRLGYAMSHLGDVGVTMDYLQSMTWDHNTGKLYWSRFDGDFMNTYSDLYVIDPKNVVDGKVAAEKVGTLTTETCAMFAPLTQETINSNEIYLNVPDMDAEIVARPVLRDDVVTMNVGSLRGLIYDLDPWYSNYKDVIWTSSDPSVVDVNQSGVISAVSTGSATITVTNADDETKFDTLIVEVTALDLEIEGIVSSMGSGVGNVGGVCTYKYEMVDGVGNFEPLNRITAPEELNYGLSLATSVMARGYIWACEYGNTGMVYKIDPATGVVVDVLAPVDGDMLFGMTYSKSQDTFAAIMNMYLFVDLELTHEESDKMLDSYDEQQKMFTYHRLNLLDCLIAAGDGFVTGETGQGASSEVVFCGITTIEDSFTFVDNNCDFLGNPAYNGVVNYVSDQTLVLLDNVGRLWYIDEIIGLSKVVDEYGNAVYTSEDGTYIEHNGQLRNGMFELAVEDEEGNVTYNVFNIRRIEETPLTSMFHDGTMPRYTYHFSDIEFAGYDAAGAPMFALSLYDYWNNGLTNELYLYVASVGTGEFVMNQETWMLEEVMTESRFYTLGDTGKYNVIASIHSVKVTGGVDPEEEETITVNRYNP